jgi:hypothetical protein
MTAEISPLSRDPRVRLSAYLGVLFAYLAAVHDDPWMRVHLGLFAVATAWSLAVEHRLRTPFFGPRLKIGLIALGAALFVLFIARRGPADTLQFSNSISRFLFWNALVFVLSRNKSEYDFWTLGIIELSLFMISGSFVQPPLFLPLLLASLSCALYGFLRIALLKAGAHEPLPRLAWSLLVVAFLFIVELAAVFFVATPRSWFRGEGTASATGVPPEGDPVASADVKTGIPRSAAFLRLENFSRLKTDPTPVLRVRVRDLQDKTVPAERTQYLRGAVLDRYENGGWSAAFRRLAREDADDGQIDGWTPLDPRPPAGRAIVRQQIRTSALSEDLTFALPDAVRVQWKRARYDPSGILFFAEPPNGMTEYYVESALMPADLPQRVSSGEAPPGSLQLPPGLPRLRELARRLVTGLGEGRHARTSRFVHYLTHNGFSYRLDPFVAPAGRDPVEHFLELRTGYCVQYAGALALLCRAVGIPARVATGFQLHDPQEDGSFVVRNSDAHAWVEVWFGPDHGWRAYDATPETSAEPPKIPEGDPVASVDDPTRKKDADAAGGAGRWDRFISDFDPAAQARAFEDALRILLAFLRALAESTLLRACLALLALGALLSWLFMPKRSRLRLRQLVTGFREQTGVDFWRDFLWVLSRRGIRRHPSLTAWEFARQIRGQIADEGVDFVVEKFYEARFRGRSPEPDERARIDAIIERLSRPPLKT